MQSPYSQRQALFARLFGLFLVWLTENGYEYTFGEGYVKALANGDVPGHMHGSAHGDRMAEDLNVYLAGRWMDGLDIQAGGKGSWQSPHWEKIGAKWESLDPLCRWGGRFANKDYNHFSVTPDGKRA